MGGRKKGKKGKKAMSGTHGDLPEVSGFAPGNVNLQGEGKLDKTLALSTDNNLLPPLNMADRMPAVTTAPAGNAYEKRWSLIRPDRDASAPQVQPNRHLGRASKQLGAPSTDALGRSLFGEQVHDSSPSQIPSRTSYQSSMRLPTLPHPVPHPYQASVPTGVANISTPPQQAGTANTFSGPPSGLKWQPPNSQLPGLAGGITPQVGQAGQGGSPTVPGQSYVGSTGPYLILTQLPNYHASRFSSLRAIEEYLRKPIWFPYSRDWMLPDEAEQWKYIAKVYNGIVDLRNVFDEELRYAALFRPGQRWSDPKEIEAISYLVVTHAIKIHRDGVTNLRFKAPETVKEVDRCLTFSQRIHFVAMLLTHFKQHAFEFMAQRRFEDIIANVYSFLFQQQSFVLWWDRLSKEQQEQCMFLDPYDGMAAWHPSDAQYYQWKAMSKDLAVSNLTVSAAAGQQQGQYGYPAPTAPQAPVVPGYPASQQHQFQAGSSGSDQRGFQLLPEFLGRRVAPGEEVRHFRPVGKRQQNLTALDTMAPTGSNNPLQTLHPTPTPTESGFQNLAAQHDPDFSHLVPVYDYSGALDLLDSGIDPLWRPAGLQGVLGSADGYRSESAQSVGNAVPEGAGKPIGGDAEETGGRSEGEDGGS